MNVILIRGQGLPLELAAAKWWVALYTTLV